MLFYVTVNGRKIIHIKKKYSVTDVRLLVGMQYVPLREEFRKSNAYEQRENSILITTGGTDTYNVTYKVKSK